MAQIGRPCALRCTPLLALTPVRRFIESEAELHGSLGALVVLTTNPPLFYPEAVRNSLPQTLCALLSHENVDIVAKVVELVEEMTDDDVLDVGISGAAGADDDDDEAPERAGEKAVGDFVDVLVSRVCTSRCWL